MSTPVWARADMRKRCTSVVSLYLVVTLESLRESHGISQNPLSRVCPFARLPAVRLPGSLLSLSLQSNFVVYEKEVQEWGFDCLRHASISPSPLVDVGFALLERTCDDLYLPGSDILLRFLKAVEVQYNPVPYHNCIHGLMVRSGIPSVHNHVSSIVVHAALCCYVSNCCGVSTRYVITQAVQLIIRCISLTSE